MLLRQQLRFLFCLLMKMFLKRSALTGVPENLAEFERITATLNERLFVFGGRPDFWCFLRRLFG